MKTIMKAAIFTAIYLYIGNVQAQNDYNPYAQFGVKAQVLTLSEGKYIEFFDTDTIEVIGSAVLNTKTMKVIGFIEVDTLYSEDALQPEIVSRWLSPDPMARMYPSLSPYNFAANNPIYFVDPDGGRIVVHYVNENGRTAKIVIKSQADVKALLNHNNAFVRAAAEDLNKLVEGNYEEINYAITTRQRVHLRYQKDQAGFFEPLEGETESKKGKNTIYYDPEADIPELTVDAYDKVRPISEALNQVNPMSGNPKEAELRQKRQEILDDPSSYEQSEFESDERLGHEFSHWLRFLKVGKKQYNEEGKPNGTRFDSQAEEDIITGPEKKYREGKGKSGRQHHGGAGGKYNRKDRGIN